MSDHPIPDRHTVRAAVRLGCRAPSVHNTQPWHWDLDGATLTLRADPERRLAAADPNGRQAVISCGAVLHHVRTAFAAHRWHTDVTRLPDPERPELLAAITFRPWPAPPVAVLRRAEAIDRRYTDRLPMREPAGWASIRLAVEDLVAAHDLTLDILDADARGRLVTASEQSDALRRYDPQYQREISWWSGHSDTPEGVPPEALASPSEQARVGVARTFAEAGPSARRTGLDDHARLAVLTATGDTTAEWLHAGEALSSVLLECTASGLVSCALTHLTEHPAGRRLLAALTGHPGIPQALVRIGSAPDEPLPPPTPRRPLVDVLSFA
ncbi:Acg family FMN-binding oxidoreductase [Nocardia thailandica]|uniref:Acg family FMN-binding oxidoreductase n=1 Tax=Nocardia thailandica TaxID=257275 RepID=A0ABW6PTL4_9NOCA